MRTLPENILVGGGLFALIGPPIGGAEMALFICLGERHQITGVMDVLALIGFSYFFGLIHALGTGALSGAIIGRCRRVGAFISFCLVAEAAVAWFLFYLLGFGLFTHDTVGLAVMGAIPTALCAAIFWYWIRRRKPSESLRDQIYKENV